MLAMERARRMRGTAAVAVSGVVASLSLAVALTVMVASFRDSVTRWLDVVLPADLYLRATSGGAAATAAAAAADTATFSPAFVQALAQLPGVARTGTLRTRPLQLDATRPAVTLIARSLEGGAARSLPLVGRRAAGARRADRHLRERGDGGAVRRPAGHRLRAAGGCAWGLRARLEDGANVLRGRRVARLRAAVRHGHDGRAGLRAPHRRRAA